MGVTVSPLLLFGPDKQSTQQGTSKSNMSVHTVLVEEEQVAFADRINDMFGKDTDVNHKLPLKKDGSDMYEAMDDGILLCKIINLAAPDTIDERAINKGKTVQIFKQHENLTLARNSASSVGVDSHNIRSEKKQCYLVLGLVWQLIRMHLFRQININEVPGLVNLLREGETLADLMKLGPEEILLRWVNYQLEKEGSERRAKNLTTDIKDSEIYTDLLHQIAPKDAGVNKTAMQKSDLVERAGVMLDQADKIGCKQFVTPKDVKNGHEKLNLAFVANLFNTHPHLDPPAEDLDIIEETREEKTFRNWMNSLGVSPRVNYLYSDLSNGLILFQLMNFIKPGTCDMKMVVDKVKLDSLAPQKQHFEMLTNCDYAIECGKKLDCKLVGIGGSDLKEGHQMFTLAFVWQLMRAYTLSLLAKLSADGKPVKEAEIIEWTNNKLSEGGKSTQIRDFKDKANRTALPIIDIVDIMKPGTINYEFVKTGSSLSDEVNDKMVMTVYASLMLADAEAKKE